MSTRKYIATESFKRFGYDPALAYIVAGIGLIMLPFVKAYFCWKYRAVIRQLNAIGAQLDRIEKKGGWTL
jgi:hypothetical protein